MRVKLLHDYEGRKIRMTDERLKHILEHPEMAHLSRAIEETLTLPGKVIQSSSDHEARLYYRSFTDTPVGKKYLCIVVKIRHEDAFVLTAYLTDTVKKGVMIWQGEQ